MRLTAGYRIFTAYHNLELIYIFSTYWYYSQHSFAFYDIFFAKNICKGIQMNRPIIDLELSKEKYTARIRNIREDHDYTQKYVAYVLGIRQTVYARYERGIHDLPVRHLLALSKFYGVSTDYLLGLSDKK